MLTSTSLNAPFIAKLAHAANVAIACQSYCEVVTSKGKPSVLVEWETQTNSLRFTHISGQDVTALCWGAIKGFIVLPSEVKHVQDMAEDLEEDENNGYGFIMGYLLFVFIGLMVALKVVSMGSAVLVAALVVAAYRVATTHVERPYRSHELGKAEPNLS